MRNYLEGYEKKDWNLVSSQFADGFTFTSPAGDDHISLVQYQEKCFPTSKFVKNVKFTQITVDGNTAFAIYEIATTDNKQVRNVEYYTFNKGKIKSIECFFGVGINYPGSGK
ncbi:MAG: nuclear transport factor 2 family protein [Bacteroidetes bacterium]|nr:nuclear transport factor 2 family protein [Bacteroidota bacterium]